MYCPQCGKKIPDQVKFCVYCGSSLTEEYGLQGQESRTPGQRKAGVAGIIVGVIAVLIVVPLALFAVFHFGTGKSEERGGRRETVRESRENGKEQEDSDDRWDQEALQESSEAPEYGTEGQAPFLPFSGEAALFQDVFAGQEGFDSVSVSWTRMNHSYWDENQSGAFVNCYYDLASVPEDTEIGHRINAELNKAYVEFLEENQIGEVYSGGFDEGEINYENGMEGMVTQNADGLLSLKYYRNWNMGGVGDGSCSGVTIDLKTGERLYLSDIRLPDGSAVTFDRMEEIARNFVVNSGMEVEDTLLQQFRDQSLDDLEFYVEEGQIVLCIAKYELGPGSMGAPEIPTGIYTRFPEGDKVDIDPRTLPSSLTEFLQSFNFAYFTDNGGREYDCQDLSNVYDRFPKGIVGNPTYVNVSMFSDDVETSWESGADPLGRYPAGMGYIMVPRDTAMFIMENVFNIPGSEATAMLSAAMSADPDFYEYEKNGTVYLCNKIGGVGGPGYEITYESVRYDGERYYIVYNCSEAIPMAPGSKVYYAEMALKERDGLKYWSLYYHSEIIPEQEDPAEAADISGDAAWLGTWTSDSGESLEIYGVSETGLSLIFNKFIENGEMGSYDYEMEFDNADNTVASEIGGPMDHGGWEYTFVLGDGYITVESRYPDQVFHRES